MDYTPTHRIQNYRASRRNHRKISLQCWDRQRLPEEKAESANQKREKKGKLDFIKTENFQKTLLRE